MIVEPCVDPCCPLHLPDVEHGHVVIRPEPGIPLWPAVVAALFALTLVAGVWWWTW